MRLWCVAERLPRSMHTMSDLNYHNYWMNLTENQECTGSTHARSCVLTSVESAKRDAIAGLRLVTSFLSILGTSSIIASTIAKRQVSSPKVHPIFVLCIADCMLAILWVVGGALWMNGVEHSRVGCFAVSLTTVILECVTINLTLVYAIFAHSYIRNTRFPSGLFQTTYTMDETWHPLRVAAIYLLAWVLPMIIVLVPFLALGVTTDIIEDASSCSCWCMPEFSNVIPTAFPIDRPTVHYNYNLKKLVLSYAVIISAHYLIAFLLLLCIYTKILKHIRKLKNINQQNRLSSYYGATDMIIVRGHSEAKQRVLLYFFVFISSGLCNLLLGLFIIIHLSEELHSYKTFNDLPLNPANSSENETSPFKNSLLAVFLIQSITVPLQGFLNAIVYGWTRGDFLHAMAVPQSHAYHKEAEITSSLPIPSPELISAGKRYTPDNLLSVSY